MVFQFSCLSLGYDLILTILWGSKVGDGKEITDGRFKDLTEIYFGHLKSMLGCLQITLQP